MCSSGDQTAASAEKASAAFQDTLTQSFKTQFGQNQEIYKFLTGALQPQITNPQGYGDTALAAMRTNATDTIASQYDNAKKALQNRQFVNGGEALPSGVNSMQTGALALGQASDTAKTQNDITTADANLKQQNYWNAISALNGVNQGNNASATAGNANSADNTTAGLSEAVTKSKEAAMSPFNALIGAVGGAGAAALSPGGAATKALFGGCWLAAAHFDGWDDSRTIDVRQWLHTSFVRDYWYGRLVMCLYMVFGECLSRDQRVVKMLGPLFDKALAKARGESC